MLVSRKWLEEYLDLSSYSDKELYDIFTAHVCEVELMYKTCDASNMTVAKVLTCEAIPETHLHKCSVEVRPGEVTQIVCGAPNVEAGKLVIAANPGAILPGNFKIKASKIRGIESNGMLCSLQELGVEEKYVPEAYKNGIYLFERGDVKVGDNPLEYLGINDTIYDLEVTSNRSDLLSIEGVLFDLAAAINQKFIKPLKEVKDEISNDTTVSIETDNCYKYRFENEIDENILENLNKFKKLENLKLNGIFAKSFKY
jgi:phenylalanyl-tRNA synthetase beta chain